MVEISTPDDRRFMATEWRNVWGVMFFSDRLGAAMDACDTMALIRVRTPERVSISPFLFRNKALSIPSG